MEKLLNHCDKECMKMAMLKHEETFREQVYELHRLYQIQKMLMKDVARNPHNGQYHETNRNRVEAQKRPVNQDFKVIFSDSARKCGVFKSEEEDESDLELTLGPKIYYQKKIKAAGASDSGPGFSSSSSTTDESGRLKGTRKREDFSRQQKWGMEMPLSSNQDRLNSSPPWLFQALSLNI